MATKSSEIADKTADFFIKLGFDERTARNTLANAKLTNNLLALIHEVATKFPANAMVHRPALAEYVVSSKIKTPAQLDAAFAFFSSIGHDNFDPSDFEKACGVGVEVSNEEVERIVGEIFEESKVTIVELRYKTNVGDLFKRSRERQPWADAKIVKQVIDTKLLELLGERTAADEKPVKTKKEKPAKVEDCNNGEDRISELPDDILLTYILPAGMKEAAKTSIISKQWRSLWAKRTDLDFNYLIVLPESEPNLPGDPKLNDLSSFTVGEKNKYINWVNQVVGLHCSPYIDTFKVAFKFDGNDGHHIDKWVTFALMKKVQNLQLRVYSQGVVYTLSLDTIKPSLSVVDSGINCLKTLYLRNVDVSGDVLEYLLSQCCLLEQLCVTHSRTLVRLRVVGLCSKLKKLTITGCWKLEELVVDAANLVCLRYGTSSHGTKAVFKSMPALVDAKFYGYCFSVHSSFFQQISHLAAQITTLYLDLLAWNFPTGVMPIFCNLKRLRIRVDGKLKFNLYSMNRFLKAFPTLRELKVEIVWNRSRDDELLEEGFVLEEVDLSRDDVEVANMYGWQYFERKEHSVLKRTQLPNLEELQVVGFSGYDADVDLILFIVLLASNLKTIICDPSRFIALTSEEVAETRSRAAKLMKLIRPKISLVNL